MMQMACAVAIFGASIARAHNPDTSYLRCVVAKHALDLRFTFDIATLFRIARPDADGDGRVTRAELDQITPGIFDYLEKSVPIEINGTPAPQAVRGAVEWPPEAADAILEKDYRQVLVHYPLRVESPAPIEDFYVDYEGFDELGDRHRVIADIEQNGRHQEVIFTMFEPDYLYDTGWQPEDVAEPPRSKIWFKALVERFWSLPGPMITLALVSILQLQKWLKAALGLLLLVLSWKSCLIGCHVGAPPPPVWLAGLATTLALILPVLVALPLRWLLDCWRSPQGFFKQSTQHEHASRSDAGL